MQTFLKRNISLIASLSIAVIVGLIVWKYAYYEDDEDPYLSAISSGQFSGCPIPLPTTLGAIIGLNYIMTWLYESLPKVDWYALMIMFGAILMAIQSVLIAKWLFPHIARLFGTWVSAIALLCIGVLFAENVFLLQLTRISMLLSAFSIFRLWLNVHTIRKLSVGFWFSQAFCVFCFIYAGMIRLEPAVLCMVIWLPTLALSKWQGTSTKRLILILVPLLVVIGVLSFFVNNPETEADRQYLMFRKYEFSLQDFSQPISTLKLKNNIDTAIYDALSQVVLYDTAYMNAAFYERIGVWPIDKTLGSIPYYFRNLVTAKDKLQRSIDSICISNKGLLALYLFTTLLGALYIGKRGGKYFAAYFAAQLFNIFLYIAITSFMKMENRVLVPMIWCFILQNLVWNAMLVPSPGIVLTSKMRFAIIMLVPPTSVLCAYCSSRELTEKYVGVKTEFTLATNLLNEALSRPEKILASTLLPNLLSSKPFVPIPDLKGKLFITVDNFFCFFIPACQAHIKSICGHSQPIEVIKALIVQKNNVLFVNPIERIQIYRTYFNQVYHLDFDFVPISAGGDTLNIQHSVLPDMTYKIK